MPYAQVKTFAQEMDEFEAIKSIGSTKVLSEGGTTSMTLCARQAITVVP